MKHFAAGNWRIGCTRLAFLVGILALCIPGVSRAEVPHALICQPNVLLLLGTGLVGMAFAGRKSRK
jgi:hypothetical protein